MLTFSDMDSAFTAAQNLADRKNKLFCVMARNAKNHVLPWGVCSDNQATVHVNDCCSDWTHWANVRPAQSLDLQPQYSDVEV